MFEDLTALEAKTSLTRREFVVTTLATGFALAVRPVSAQTITTDTTGLIAGEALVGLLIAGYVFFTKKALPGVFDNPSYMIGLLVLFVMAWTMVYIPLRNAGRPDEPAPPAAMM